MEDHMKQKRWYVALLAALMAVVLCFSVGCGEYGEVAGTYEMRSISGNINGVTIDESYYEYFRIILKANGDGKVQSKGSAAGSVAYEAEGTFVYENGEIRFTTKNGSANTTEVYLYKDGVITYQADLPQMKFTLVLERAE